AGVSGSVRSRTFSVFSSTLTCTPDGTVMPYSFRTAAGSASSLLLKPSSAHALATPWPHALSIAVAMPHPPSKENSATRSRHAAGSYFLWRETRRESTTIFSKSLSWPQAESERGEGVSHRAATQRPKLQVVQDRSPLAEGGKSEKAVGGFACERRI